jgi:hypothetical protein
MKDLSILRWVSVLIGLIGQFPVEEIQGTLLLSYFSVQGVWSLLVFIFHAISFQTIVGFLHSNIVYAVKAPEYFKIVGISVTYTFLSHGTYLLWFCSISKFLKVWRDLDEYDKEFGPTAFGPVLLTFTQLSLIVSWGFSSLMDIYTLRESLLAALEGRFGHEKSFSWVKSITNSTEITVWTAGTLHMFLVSSSIFFSLTFISFFSKGIAARSQKLSKDIDIFVSEGLSSEAIWSLTKRVGVGVGVGEHATLSKWFSQVFDQVKMLNDAFISLSDAGEILIFWFMSLGTILICITLFILTPIKLSQYTEDPIFFALFSTVLIVAIRMLALAKSGENLQNGVSFSFYSQFNSIRGVHCP